MTMKRRISRTLALALAATATTAASADAASFGCSSSAARLSVLGQTALEPVKANPGIGACSADTKTLSGPAAALPSPVNASALVAATEVYPAQKSVLAQGGIADLTVASLPSLPITLPAVAVPDAARALLADALKVNVNLAPVKALIPVLPTDLVTTLITTLTDNLPTDLPELLPDLPELASVLTTVGADLNALLPANLPETLRTDLPETTPPVVLDAADPALDTIAEVDAINALITAANVANAAANAANLAANGANTAANLANDLVNNFDVVEVGEVLSVTTALATNDVIAKNIAANAANAAAEIANTAANDANQALNTAMAALNAAHVITNAANAALNIANAALNTVRSSIPDTVAFDGSASLDALLAALLPDGKLPNVELLNIRGAMAYAVGSCQSGTPAVTGSSTVTGIKVLGQTLPVGQVIDRVLGLIDSANIDPSDLALPALGINDLGLTDAQKALIASIPLDAATNALNTAIQTARDAINAALDALDAIHVLDATVAQVKVTPGTQVKSGGAITQQALTVLVTIAGQKVLEAVVGEAKASSAGVDCDDPVVDPDNPVVDVPKPGEPGAVIDVPGIKGPVDTSTPAGAALQCSTRRLVLVDVLERKGRVKLFGVADPALARKTVSIVLEATHKTVARAKIAKDGSFDTTAPLPPPNIRDTNDARYTAVLGKEESINLKLRRRMIITSTSTHGRNVTIIGRVIPPLGKPLQPITLTRRVSCTKDSLVKVFKPNANGRFRITVKAPKGLGTAVYRMTTKVRNSFEGSGLFETYTLPRAVDLS